MENLFKKESFTRFALHSLCCNFNWWEHSKLNHKPFWVFFYLNKTQEERESTESCLVWDSKEYLVKTQVHVFNAPSEMSWLHCVRDEGICKAFATMGLKLFLKKHSNLHVWTCFFTKFHFFNFHTFVSMNVSKCRWIENKEASFRNNLNPFWLFDCIWLI